MNLMVLGRKKFAHSFLSRTSS